MTDNNTHFHVAPSIDADKHDEEVFIMQRCAAECRPADLPNGISLLETHVHRDIFSNMIVVQIFYDELWGEFRVRNISNCQLFNCIDVLYKNKMFVEVAQLTVDAIEKQLV